MTARISSLRAQLAKAQQQLPRLLEDCFGREPLLPGSLYTLRRKCGKPNCHCARGELHESIALSYRGEGGPQNLSPPAEQLDLLRQRTDNYRRVRQARAKLVRWQRDLLRLVDGLVQARVELGEGEFQKLRAAVKQNSRTRR